MGYSAGFTFEQMLEFDNQVGAEDTALVEAVRTVKQFLTFVGGAPFQPAVAYALDNESEWVARLRDDLAVKRTRLSAGLAENVYEGPVAPAMVTPSLSQR